LIPAVATMTQNQYKRLKLTDVEITAHVSPHIELATLTNARINRTAIAPGQTLTITLQLQPYGKPAVYRRIHLKIPPDMPEGDYPLMISGARQYAAAFTASHPYLFQTQSVDDIYHTLKKLLAIRNN